MVKYLVINKEEREVNGVKFPVWYGFRQHKDDNGQYVDEGLFPATDKEGKSIMKAKSTKVVPVGDIAKQLDNIGYPLRLTLDENDKCADGKSSFSIDIDKKKDGTIKLDKNGKQHAVIYIRKITQAYKLAPRMTLDDIDNL